MHTNRITHLCPVDRCPQPHAERVAAIYDTPLTRLTIPFDTIRHGGIDAAITEAVGAAAATRARAVDEVLLEHARSHDVLDYLRTIHRLQCDVAGHESGIRPHWPASDAPDRAFLMRDVPAPAELRRLLGTSEDGGQVDAHHRTVDQTGGDRGRGQE